ncbi:MAG: hypothetical protein AVDCRST_MAG49-1414 [uncultured Thermomicrobiales bacterium]|uniref:Uncharacterized protein n=1 Tax=uncultured Thermomicrobiales bacterium TaxID=1645740 RepID=A0A6J4UCC0_9BACT|nr:MAG: hypothetical protein AVDCRST_MAG49-1414 [uncultured Thermomicrobiales bacterium]
MQAWLPIPGDGRSPTPRRRPTRLAGSGCGDSGAASCVP